MKQRKTLHMKLSEEPRRKGVNKQASLMLHSAQPEFIHEFDEGDHHKESYTFIKHYPYETWVSYHPPAKREDLFNRIIHSGFTFGKLTVLGVYLPNHDETIADSIRFERYKQQGRSYCHCCGQVLRYKSGAERPIPKLRWVCRCDCGYYKVISSAEAYKAHRTEQSLSCSACAKVAKVCQTSR
tara:strand:+ start:184 stop:732 length:549 start_codon:yes stop_codon:yes gene_type:complete